MSTHTVSVIEIGDILPHPNADRLDIIPIPGTSWQVVAAKGQFTPGAKGVYVQPDYVVPTTRPEFAFLAKGKDSITTHRLRAVRLRGALSFGLLIPMPAELDGVPAGANVMEELGIARYVPPSFAKAADTLAYDKWPALAVPKFDIESLSNYPSVLEPGERVLVTEKIHGANAKYVFHNGEMYVGSRNRWLKPDDKHFWSEALANDPRIEAWCRAYPDVVLFGEVYGPVQSLRYGSSTHARFAAFAALNAPTGEWIDVADLVADLSLPTAPFIYIGPWKPEDILTLAEEDSTVEGTPKGHMREGLVIVPVRERVDPNIGRVILKHISSRYWTSSES